MFGRYLMSSHKIPKKSFGLQVGCKFYEIIAGKMRAFFCQRNHGFSNSDAATVILSERFPAGNVSRHFDFK